MQKLNTVENQMTRNKRGWHQFSERGILLVLIGICVILSIVTPYFRQVTNIINIARQISEISISAFGMTFLIICAEFDLSVGSVFAFVGLSFLLLMQAGLGVFPKGRWEKP